jgi:thioredoxin reductase (NADPH)
MSGPVLIAVDEDAGVMRDVERELRDRYARHYRVVCMRSPREVLARLEELAAEGEQVALVLAGQRLSGMTGSELLDQARHLHSHAKAWAADGVG